MSRKNNDSTDTHDYKWWIPLTIKTGANPLGRTVDWLSTEDVEKTIPIPAIGAQYVLLNIDQQSLFSK